MRQLRSPDRKTNALLSLVQCSNIEFPFYRVILPTYKCFNGFNTHMLLPYHYHAPSILPIVPVGCSENAGKEKKRKEKKNPASGPFLIKAYYSNMFILVEFSIISKTITLFFSHFAFPSVFSATKRQ